MKPSPWNPTNLEPLQRQGHFRLRGAGMTRLETFIDAAFAFAVTMLVISVENIPQTFDEFTEALRDIPAFIASFLQLIMFWLGHRAWSRRYGLEDTASLWLSLALVCGILVIVYPLRVLFASGFGYLTDGFLPYSFEVGWHEMKYIFAIYGFGFGTLCSLVAVLFLHALRKREWLGLDAREALATRIDAEAWLILALTGFIGMLIAVFAPGTWTLAGGWIYMTLMVVMPTHAWLGERRLLALTNQTG